MPPEGNSDVDFFTENESEIEIKNLDDELEYFSSDVHEFRKAFEMDTETEAENNTSGRSSAIGVAKTRKYVCPQPECGETFRRKTQFDRHVFKHTGIKTHKCTVENCDKEYTISTALKRHLLTFHNKERDSKTFKCLVPECGKAFDSAWNLERHSKRRHENPTKYKCDICQCEFQRKLKLKFHIVSVHTKEYPFHCEKCGKKFITEHFFKNHNCKTYICEVCTKVFTKWTQLTEHKKTSTKCALKYKCPECNKEFKHPQLLKDHEQVHKSKDERTGFPCTFEGCTSFYTMKKNLDAHFRRKHGDLKDAFKCSFENCGLTLSTKKKLEEHIEKKHVNVPSPKKKAGPRNIRKDAGKKKNVLGELTGLDIPVEVEKEILETKDTEILNIIDPHDF